jgi:hypothetical protein
MKSAHMPAWRESPTGFQIEYQESPSSTREGQPDVVRAARRERPDVWRRASKCPRSERDTK